MKTLKREGYCKQEDLPTIIEDLLEAISIINITHSIDALNVDVNVINFNINYKNGKYDIEFNYSIGERGELKDERDDEQEGTFRENT